MTTAATLADLGRLADLLDQEPVWAVVAGAIADSRDRSPRIPDDRDSGQVLDDVIAILRATAAQEPTP